MKEVADAGQVVVADVALLRLALEGAFERIGLSAPEAGRIADSLVAAELCEVPTHGMLRVPWYIRDYTSGKYNKDAAITVTRTLPGVALVDGDGSLGFLPTWRAVSEAVEAARHLGVGVAGVVNIAEFGRAAYFVEEVTRQGCVGLVCQNTIPLLAAPGSSTATHGNNPLSFSAPGDDAPLFDAAFTIRSGGELARRAMLGQSLPREWGYRDADGAPTTDPKAAIGAVQQAVGGAKGFGLALLVDLLAGALTGAASGPQAKPGVPRLGAMVIALDPNAFGSLDQMAVKLSLGADAVRSGGGRWPGDRAKAARRTHLSAGTVEVPVPIYEAAQVAAGGFHPDPRRA